MKTGGFLNSSSCSAGSIYFMLGQDVLISDTEIFNENFFTIMCNDTSIHSSPLPFLSVYCTNYSKLTKEVQQKRLNIYKIHYLLRICF